MEEQLNDDTTRTVIDQQPSIDPLRRTLDSETLVTVPLEETKANVSEPIDPLRRVWIPIEKKLPDGNMLFRTTDKTVYVRLQNGAIMRARPKLRGKAARKAERIARASRLKL